MLFARALIDDIIDLTPPPPTLGSLQPTSLTPIIYPRPLPSPRLYPRLFCLLHFYPRSLPCFPSFGRDSHFSIDVRNLARTMKRISYKSFFPLTSLRTVSEPRLISVPAMLPKVVAGMTLIGIRNSRMSWRARWNLSKHQGLEGVGAFPQFKKDPAQSGNRGFEQ